MRHKMVLIIFILVLATIACGFPVGMRRAATPGAEITDQIAVPASTSDEKRVRLEFGAGTLNISSGEADHLITGTATYNIPALKPQISVQGNEVLLQQGEYDFKVIPNPGAIKNEWDLKLAPLPMELSIAAGAYKAQYEFGGLALTRLTIQDGAATVALNFSAPNQAEMSLFRYETGASNVVLRGLANANFSTFAFKSGAGAYTLGFDGQLQRDGTVTIESGLSNITLIIPEGLHTIVSVESGLTNINAGPGWRQEGNRYVQEGSSPTLTFVIKMGAGNLTLTH